MKRIRNFIDNDINKHLYCPICQEVFYKPSRATCGHTFCKPCIAIWANIKQNCPLCRKKIKKSHFEKDLLPSKIIDELKIQCPNTGCQWIDKSELLSQHLKVCKTERKQEKSEKNQKQVQIIEDKEGAPQTTENNPQQNQIQEISQPIQEENCQEPPEDQNGNSERENNNNDIAESQQAPNQPVYPQYPQYYPSCYYDLSQVVMVPVVPIQYYYPQDGQQNQPQINQLGPQYPQMSPIQQQQVPQVHPPMQNMHQPNMQYMQQQFGQENAFQQEPEQNQNMTSVQSSSSLENKNEPTNTLQQAVVRNIV